MSARGRRPVAPDHRNGLPGQRPYVYRGTVRDVPTGVPDGEAGPAAAWEPEAGCCLICGYLTSATGHQCGAL